jgi:arachidonate 15-lipoxygenase
MPFFSREAVIPLLPQNDPDLDKRYEKLARAQADYTYNYSFIPDLPMAESVPGDDSPSMEWKILVGKIALNLLFNTVLAREKQSPNTLENLAKMNEFNSLLQQVSANPQNIETNLQDLGAMIEALKASGTGDSFAEYKEIFKRIPLPDVVKIFQEDAWFGWMRVAGPNPLVIQRVTDRTQVFISEDKYQLFIPEETLDEAIAKGRLYLADYSTLSAIEAGSFPDKQKYITSPKALFVVKDRALLPLGIKIDELVFTPNVDETDWSWEIAKTLVQIADANHHELISHLGHTHLVIEPFVLATRRRLAPNHPLYILLLPHFEGTLYINDEAQKKLVTAGGSVDALLAGSIQSSRTFTAQNVKAFNFNQSMLPKTLAARGVDDINLLPIYPYRDDGLLIWNAIKQWVSDYLSIYYQNDDNNIKTDTELQAWIAELLSANGGRMTNIGEDGEIKTFAYLVECVTLIIFTASAQHAAVNFPQSTIMSYAPAIPFAGYAPAPTSELGASKEDYFKLLPPVSEAQGQLNLNFLLGSVFYTRLGEYTSILDMRVQQRLRNFQDNLKAIEVTIRGRNERRFASYPYLRPSQIPQSINI